MKITFGIITSKKSVHYLEEVLKSIYNLKINKSYFEIIIVGNKKISGANINSIAFHELQFSKSNLKIMKNWITRKKNLIVSNARFENLIIMHDYLVFDENWYNSFLDFKCDFDVCITPIKNADGSRYRDWTLWPHNNHVTDSIILKNHSCLLPYNEDGLSRFMYISGAYWIAKTDFMLTHPLNENLVWGQAEDVEWSIRVREKTIFKINKNTHVKLLKNKDRIFNEISREDLVKFKSLI